MSGFKYLLFNISLLYRVIYQMHILQLCRILLSDLLTPVAAASHHVSDDGLQLQVNEAPTA